METSDPGGGEEKPGTGYMRYETAEMRNAKIKIFLIIGKDERDQGGSEGLYFAAPRWF